MENAKQLKLITDTKLAIRLGVKASWLRSEADSNRLPHVKADKRYLFDADVVERILWERAQPISEAYGTNSDHAESVKGGGQ